MPDPKKFKNEKEWMSACMPHLLQIEKKKRDQAIAQCIGMWRQWQKKANDPKNKIIARRIISAFLAKQSSRILSPGDALKKDRELERWRKNLDKKVTPLLTEVPPYKEGEIINVLIDGEFVEMPYSKDLKKQKFIYIAPKTNKLVENIPVHE